MPSPFSLVLALAVAVAVFFLLRRRRGTAERPRESSDAVDGWIKEALPGALERQLARRGVEATQIARAIGGDPDPAVVSTVEQHVREVQIEYAREPQGSDVEVTLRVRFDDGAEETARRRMTLGEVPAAVRADFESKATTRAFRAWHFPWVRGL